MHLTLQLQMKITKTPVLKDIFELGTSWQNRYYCKKQFSSWYRDVILDKLKNKVLDEKKNDIIKSGLGYWPRVKLRL